MNRVEAQVSTAALAHVSEVVAGSPHGHLVEGDPIWDMVV